MTGVYGSNGQPSSQARASRWVYKAGLRGRPGPGDPSTLPRSCLPGCTTPAGWDHRCVSRVAVIERPPARPGGLARWVAVDVDQDLDVPGAPAVRRVLVIDALPSDDYVGDPIELDPDRAAEVAGAVLRAAAIARPGVWRWLARVASTLRAATR